jgi:hypothetical protein
MNALAPGRAGMLRVVFLAYMLAVLSLCLLAVNPRLQQLQTVSAGDTTLTGQLSSADADALADGGLSLEQYAAYFTTFELVAVLLFWSLGVFLLWRRPDDRMAVLFGLTLGKFVPISTPYLTGLAAEAAVFALLINILQALGWTLFLLTFFVFPNGRFVPKGARWLFGLWCLYILLTFPIPAIRFPASLIWRNAFEAALILWAFGWLALAAGLQIYRYRRVATAVERLQSRWVVFGLGLMVGLSFMGALPLFLLPLLDYPPAAIMTARLVAFSITLTMLLVLAATIAIAILRFRLFDVDVLIRKTLVYGLLTAVLAAVYFTSIIVLQSIFRSISGQESPLVIVLSTLLIAALFSPLRRRVQGVIDRRFFRQKYDAEQVLAHFAEHARDEVEIEALERELLAAIEETMRPERVGVWLRKK